MSAQSQEPSDLRARKEDARRRQILAITPSELEDVAARCILEGKTLEQARAIILAAMPTRAAEVRTPGSVGGGLRVADIPLDQLANALKG